MTTKKSIANDHPVDANTQDTKIVQRNDTIYQYWLERGPSEKHLGFTEFTHGLGYGVTPEDAAHLGLKDPTKLRVGSHIDVHPNTHAEDRLAHGADKGDTSPLPLRTEIYGLDANTNGVGTDNLTKLLSEYPVNSSQPSTGTGTGTGTEPILNFENPLIDEKRIDLSGSIAATPAGQEAKPVSNESSWKDTVASWLPSGTVYGVSTKNPVAFKFPKLSYALSIASTAHVSPLPSTSLTFLRITPFDSSPGIVVSMASMKKLGTSKINLLGTHEDGTGRFGLGLGYQVETPAGAVSVMGSIRRSMGSPEQVASQIAELEEKIKANKTSGQVLSIDVMGGAAYALSDAAVLAAKKAPWGRAGTAVFGSAKEKLHIPITSEHIRDTGESVGAAVKKTDMKIWTGLAWQGSINLQYGEIASVTINGKEVPINEFAENIAKVSNYLDIAQEKIQPYLEITQRKLQPLLETVQSSLQPYISAGMDRAQPYLDSGQQKLQPYLDNAENAFIASVVGKDSLEPRNTSEITNPKTGNVFECSTLDSGRVAIANSQGIKILELNAGTTLDQIHDLVRIPGGVFSKLDPATPSPDSHAQYFRAHKQPDVPAPSPEFSMRM